MTSAASCGYEACPTSNGSSCRPFQRIVAIFENHPVNRFSNSQARLLLLVPLSTLAAACVAARAAADEPWVERTDLFHVGDGGYKQYHIPGVTVTASGSVLAWAEARRSRGDWSAIDIVLRRSTDQGRTWSEAKVVARVPGAKTKNPVAVGLKNVKATDVTYNNPVFIADRDGTVTFVFCLEYCRAFVARSADDGVTWSDPVEITGVFEKFRPEYPWKVIATGPDHGIQLSSGRLLVPIWMSTGTGGNAHRPSVVATIYSDDHGASWQVAIDCRPVHRGVGQPERDHGGRAGRRPRDAQRAQ